MTTTELLILARGWAVWTRADLPPAETARARLTGELEHLFHTYRSDPPAWGREADVTEGGTR